MTPTYRCGRCGEVRATPTALVDHFVAVHEAPPDPDELADRDRVHVLPSYRRWRAEWLADRDQDPAS